jgi:hypothetical protein
VTLPRRPIARLRLPNISARGIQMTDGPNPELPERSPPRRQRVENHWVLLVILVVFFWWCGSFLDSSAASVRAALEPRIKVDFYSFRACPRALSSSATILG